MGAVTLATGLIVFAGLIGFAVVAIRCRNTPNPSVEALLRAGRALGGTVTRAPDGTFQLDAVVAGQSVHLGFLPVMSCGVPPELYAQVAVADHSSELDVHPRSTTPHPTHSATLADTPSGDIVFDEAYHVLSSSEHPVPSLIPPEARRLMVETGPVMVRMAEGQLEVRRAEPEIDAPTILNVARIAGLSARAYA